MADNNKKMNPLLFMVIATVVNLLIILVIFIALLVVGTWIASLLGASEDVYATLLVACFLISFVASFFVYKKFVAWATVKWNVDQSFGRRK